MTRRPLALLVALGLSLAFGLVHGCESSPAESAAGGGGGSAGGAGAGAGAGGSLPEGGGEGGTGAGGKATGGSSGKGGQKAQTAGASGTTMGCTGIAKPASLPADWQEYTGWSCQCPVYTPGASAQPPPPLQWGDCDFPLPGGIPCRRIVGPEDGRSSGYFATRLSDGKPILQLVLGALSYGENASRLVVTEPDAPPLVDLLQLAPEGGCEWTPQAINEDKYLFSIFNDTWAGGGKTSNEGFVAGSLSDPLPTKVMKYQANPNLTANWSVSADWIVQRLGQRTAFPWQGEGSQVVYSGALDPNGLPGHQTFAVGTSVFVEAGGLSKTAVSVWTPSGGQRQLLGWPADSTRSAGNFGTDGTNLVWTYAEGKNSQDEWVNLSVMTAPFSTDPTTVTKTQRRLRKDLKTFDSMSWVTGCGYAARREGAVAINNGLVVVRLSDGVGWVIPGGAVGSAKMYSFASVMGITCEEIFTNLSAPNGHSTVVRLRLDSLGEALPPD